MDWCFQIKYVALWYKSLCRAFLPLNDRAIAAYQSFPSGYPLSGCACAAGQKLHHLLFFVVADEEGMTCLDFVISTKTILLPLVSTDSRPGQGSLHKHTMSSTTSIHEPKERKQRGRAWNFPSNLFKDCGKLMMTSKIFQVLCFLCSLGGAVN